MFSTEAVAQLEQLSNAVPLFSKQLILAQIYNANSKK